MRLDRGFRVRGKTARHCLTLLQVGGMTVAALATLAIVLTLASSASAQTTETVLYEFGQLNSGTNPQGPLVFDAFGNLYGTTTSGGRYNSGTVFKLEPVSGGGWKQSEIYDFTGGADGGTPYAGLTVDATGNLYGTTVLGGSVGSINCLWGGCGTVFELTPDPNGGWKETVLHAFLGGEDGASPQAAVVFDQFGNLYGTTQGGAEGFGTVFKLTTVSGAWRESLLYVFMDGVDGGYPVGTLIVDTASNLYGTAAKGGSICNLYGCGVVFKLSLTSNGKWKQTVLHSFTGGKDGAVPEAGLAMDAAGNLYGTTFYGGIANACPSEGDAGCGVVFKLSPTSSGWRGAILHTFTGGADGAAPEATVTLDAAGNLYGTATAGGLNSCSTFYVGCGVVFELIHRAGAGWRERILHTFSDRMDGGAPLTGSGLILDSAGNLYGTSLGGFRSAGCPYGCGVAFELSPSATP